jgi:hypothetical protein
LEPLNFGGRGRAWLKMTIMEIAFVGLLAL